MIPVRFEDGNGFAYDTSTGDFVILFKGQVVQRFTRANAITATTLTATGTVSGATVSGAVAARTRRIACPTEAWLLGGTPPTAAAIGTYNGWSFDNDAETMHLNWRVPSDWNGTSDMALKLAWMNESGTAIADTETVIWLGSYRSKAATEVADAGTAAATSVTYTQSGPGTDKNIIVSSMPIDYDDTDQPLAAGDIVGFQLSRDFTTDTYASDATLIHAWIEYTSTVLGCE